MDAVQRDKHLYQETFQMLETTILQPTIGMRRALDSGRPMFSSDEAEPILGVESMRKTPKAGDRFDAVRREFDESEDYRSLLKR